MLQAYATQRILDKLGVENETIDISGFNWEIKVGKLKYYIKNLFNFSLYRAKKGFIRLRIKKRLDPKGLGAQEQLRVDAFRHFQNAHFHLSKRCNSKAELSRFCQQQYSDVLVGSDQLWLPLNIEADYYTLTFVPDGINKVAYATSFGVSNIPFYLKKKTARFLSNINYISVREQSGQHIVKNLTGRDIAITCDPVLLFTGEEWLSVRSKSHVFDEPYIFCYFLGNNPKHRDFARRLQKKTGLKIVALRHLDEYIPSDNSFGDFAPYDIDPGQFIDLISNAEYICTDSFHGTAFSILFKKRFYTFRRFSVENSQSTNTRVESLLSVLGIPNLLLNGNENIDECLKKKVNYDDVQAKLEMMREQSIRFLTEALSIGGFNSSDNNS